MCSGGVAVCVLILQLALGVVNLLIWLSLAADELNCLMIEKLVEMFFKLAGCFFVLIVMSRHVIFRLMS